MRLVAIDPGVHHFGWACFGDGELYGAGRWEEGKLLPAYARDADELVIELPRVYRKSKGDPTDLIDLAFAAGRYVEQLTPKKLFSCRPSDWKGQVPKPKRAEEPYIIAQRCMKALGGEALRQVEWAGAAKARWDTWDAIGLALWRLKTTGVRP